MDEKGKSLELGKLENAAKTCITDIIYLKNSRRGTSRACLVPEVSCHARYTPEHRAQSQQSGKDNWVTGKGGTQSKRKPSLSTAPAFLYSRSHESRMMQHGRLKVFLLKSVIMRGSKFLYSMFLHTGCWLAVPQPSPFLSICFHPTLTLLTPVFPLSCF